MAWFPRFKRKTDTWYGRDGDVRDQIGRTGKYDMVSIPGDPDVYLHAPQGGGIPPKPVGQRGPACRHERILNGASPLKVSQLARQVECEWREVRDDERGVWRDAFAFCEVWTLREEVRQDENGKGDTGLRSAKEWLVIRKERRGR